MGKQLGFKEGDRVRLLRDHHEAKAGTTGVVKKVITSMNIVFVTYDKMIKTISVRGNDTRTFGGLIHFTDVELISVSNPEWADMWDEVATKDKKE